MFLFNRYVIGFLFALGLIILIIVLLFSGPSKPKVTTKPLTSYASSSSVQMEIYGPIVAPVNHNQVNITVNQYISNLTIFQGYNYHVIKSVSYTNSYNSYLAFLAALGFAGYNTGTKNNASTLGYCSVGDVYTLKLINNGQLVSSYWTSSCGNDPTTYSGNFARTEALFQGQIPNYGAVTANVNL